MALSEKAPDEVGHCPKCMTEATPRGSFCPACGYDYAKHKEGAGPFCFTFPAATRAYKPSGKTTVRAVALMAAVGLSVSTLGGMLLGAITVASKVAMFAPGDPRRGLGYVVAIATTFLVRIGLPVLLGWAIGYLVSHAGARAQNRNRSLAAGTGLLSGAISFAMLYSLFIGPGGPLLPIINFCSLVLLPLQVAKESVEEQSFCERCTRPLTRSALGRLPIRHEAALLEGLRSPDGPGKLATMLRQLGPEAGGNFCEVTIERCDTCGCGFVELKTTQQRRKPSSSGAETKSQTRLVFSSAVDSSWTQVARDMQA